MMVDVTEMQPGEIGIVREIQGGHGLMRKLQSMGVRPGRTIALLVGSICIFNNVAAKFMELNTGRMKNEIKQN